MHRAGDEDVHTIHREEVSTTPHTTGVFSKLFIWFARETNYAHQDAT